MRVDKYLKNSRLIKRRTVAKEACEHGRVSINGNAAKPGTEVKVGDVLLIQFGNRQMQVKIKEIYEAPKKDEASGMYDIME